MKISRMLCGLVSLILLATPILSAQEDASSDRGQQLRDLQERIDTLTRQVAKLRRQVEPEYYTATDPEQRLAWYEKHVAMQEDPLFKDLKWQFLGPTNISGRVTDVAVPTPRGKTYTIYVATASGGVWKTTNEGTTWDPIFEHGPSTSVGDVTIAPSDPNIVWIGLGEANIFRSSMAGTGVYKSTDGG